MANEVSEDAKAIVVRFEGDSPDVEDVCEVLLALNSLVKAIAKEIDPEGTSPEVKLKWTAASKKGEDDDG
ncbi:MAG: hypothetical protein ACP5HZ_12450 [Ferrimicrobium sp.]